jgi:hypothetical protein
MNPVFDGVTQLEPDVSPKREIFESGCGFTALGADGIEIGLTTGCGVTAFGGVNEVEHPTHTFETGTGITAIGPGTAPGSSVLTPMFVGPPAFNDADACGNPADAVVFVDGPMERFPTFHSSTI